MSQTSGEKLNSYKKISIVLKDFCERIKSFIFNTFWNPFWEKLMNSLNTKKNLGLSLEMYDKKIQFLL